MSSSKGKGTASKEKAPTGDVRNWREIERKSPESAREILVATKLAGQAREVGVSVATGALGGVRPSGYRGGSSGSGSVDTSSWDCDDPWGWYSWNSCSYASYSWCGWGWGFPLYWSLYYPCWWWTSRPYYYYDYCAYPSTTVIYTQPETQVVYVDGASEAVGEVVVAGQPAVAAQPAPETVAPAASPLSIAAQRYLDLGDRAFREGRFSDAVQFYAKAVEFAPDQGALYLVLADALFAAGDYHYAAYAIRRALELDPALVESRVDKHGFYADPRQFDEHLATLERYLFDHPDDRDARLVLALNYLFGTRSSEAERLLSNATLSEDPAAQKVLAQAKAQK